MTDMELLAERLYRRIKWQSVPEDVTKEDLTTYIAESIRHLYVMTGRSSSFSEDWFTHEADIYTEFSQDLPIDEQEYVLVSAEVLFYTNAQTSVDHLVSYTTDAFSLTHGDKPFENLKAMLEDAQKRQREIWYKMTRYHHL